MMPASDMGNPDIANMAKFHVIYYELPGVCTNLIPLFKLFSCPYSLPFFFSIVQLSVVSGIVPLSFDSFPSRKSGDIVARSSTLGGILRY